MPKGIHDKLRIVAARPRLARQTLEEFPVLEMLSAIVIAVAVAGAFYVFLEWRELYSADNQGGTVSGTGTAVGRNATVIAAFEKTTRQRKPEGRIRIEGESWKAVLDGEAASLPAVGDRVTVIDMDAARLVARVRERPPASKDPKRVPRG